MGESRSFGIFPRSIRLTNRFSSLAIVLLQLQNAGLVAAVPRVVSRSAPDIVGDYTYQGCYTEPSNARALSSVTALDNMTLDLCASICSTASAVNYYFGVEYGTECWCGSELHTLSVLAGSEAECSFACPGDPSQSCGAGWRLNLYKSTVMPPTEPDPEAGDPVTIGGEPFTYMGCYTDSVVKRVLPSVVATDDMSVEKCAQLCQSAKYVGLQYGRECWCGLTIDDSSVPASAGDCDMACSGNPMELCGGGQRLTLYERVLGSGGGSSSSASVSASATITAPPAADPSPVRVGDYVSVGCYTDNNEDGRTLVYLFADDGMTLANCAAYAVSQGYAYWGVEYGRECWAGDDLNAKAKPATSGCNMPCAGLSGLSGEICGGPNRINLYSFSPAPSSTSTSDVAISTTTSAEPSATSGADGSTELDLTGGATTGSVVFNEDGSVTITPTDGGSASISIPIPADLPIEPGTPVIYQAEINVGETRQVQSVAFDKRAALTQCTLTMFLGGVPIFSQQLWTTDGNYTTVQSIATPFSVSILVLVEYCPGEAASISIGSVGVGPAPVDAASSLSSTAATAPDTTSATSSTRTTTSRALYSMTNGAASVSSTSSVTSSSFSTVTTASVVQIPTYSAHAYTTSTCSHPGTANSCYLSGAPLPTPTNLNLLAVATSIPTTGGGPYGIYDACASYCSNVVGCKSWAVEWKYDPDYQVRCLVYSDEVQTHAISYNPTYNNIAWFERNCYACNKMNLTLGTPISSSSSSIPQMAESSAGLVSSTTSVVTTTIISVVSSTSSSSVVTASSTLTSTVISKTYPTGVPFVTAAAYTASTCAIPNTPQWYTNGCTQSGIPLATTGLLAVATGIPIPANNNYQVAYEQCAGLCADWGCTSWALDRGPPPGTVWPSWDCYLYSGSTPGVMYQSIYGGIVWMNKACFNCSHGATTTSTTSTTSTISAVSSTSSSVAITTSTLATGGTSVGADGITTYAATRFTTSTCNAVNEMTATGPLPCTWSNFAQPTPTTSGLLAVVTGIEDIRPDYLPGNWWSISWEYETCAGYCAGDARCKSWVVDRANSSGTFVTDSGDWRCWLYDFSAMDYTYSPDTAQGTKYGGYAWFGRECFNCINAASSSSPWPSSIPAESTAAPTTSSASSGTVSAITGPISTASSSSTSAGISSTSSYVPDPFSGVPVVAVPTPTGTGSTCGFPTANPTFYQAGCLMSFAPLATSTTALLARATDVPIPEGGLTKWADSYPVCAGMCAGIAGCRSWALDHRATDKWACYFYSGGTYDYWYNAGSVYAGIVYNAKECWNCTAVQTIAIATGPSSTNTIAPSSVVSSTTASSTITSGPVLIPTYSAPAYVAATCSDNNLRGDAVPYIPCTISGYGLPVPSTSGLVAVATGLPNVQPNPWWNSYEQFEACAGQCAMQAGCKSWAVDRTNQTGLSVDAYDYSCWMYNFEGGPYILGNTAPWESKYDGIAWFGAGCYSCNVTSRPSAISSTSTAPSSSLPITTSSATLPLPTVSGIPFVTVAANTAGTCSRGGSGGPCTISGYAMPTPSTSGLLAIATGAPALSGNSSTYYSNPGAYESCAGLCANYGGCKSYVLDRTNITGLAVNKDDWSCWLYDFTADSWLLRSNAVTGQQYSGFAWFGAECYGCMITTRLGSISVSTTTTAPTGGSIVSSSVSTTTSASITTSASLPSTDVATGIVAPTVFSAAAYSQGGCASGYNFPAPGPPCTISGYGQPTPTNSGLLAVATGLPIFDTSQPSWLGITQFQACAMQCALQPGCRTWMVDRNNVTGAGTNALWSCWMYAFNGRDYILGLNGEPGATTGQNKGPLAWFGSDCFSCSLNLPSPASTASSSSSSVASSTAPATTFVTTTTTSTSSVPETTSSSTTSSSIATAASVPTLAVPANPPTCSKPPGQWYTNRCTQSGYATATSSLLAVATAVPPSPNFEFSYNQCAWMCAQIDGCMSFALDRTTGPNKSDWSCDFYGLDADAYLDGDFPSEAYRPVVWQDMGCFACGDSASSPTTSTTTSAVGAPTLPTYPELTTTAPVDGESTSFLSTTSMPASTSTAPTVSLYPTTTSVPTVALPILLPACSKPPGQWYTNVCTMSGIPTATSSILAVATAVPANAVGDYNFAPKYDMCAAYCAELDGCVGFALDRTNGPGSAAGWQCDFYGPAFNVSSFVRSQMPTTAYMAIVWQDMACFACDVAAPVTTSLTTSTATPVHSLASFSTTSTSSYEEDEALPTTTTSSSPASITSASSTSTSTSTSTIIGYAPASSSSSSQNVEPFGTATSAPTTTAPPPVSATCALTPNPDPNALSCGVKGFKAPTGNTMGTTASSEADCAAYCWRINYTTTPTTQTLTIYGGGSIVTVSGPGCASFMFVPTSGACLIYDKDAWTALGDDAEGGRAWKDNVMEDAGCWTCPNVG